MAVLLVPVVPLRNSLPTAAAGNGIPGPQRSQTALASFRDSLILRTHPGVLLLLRCRQQIPSTASVDLLFGLPLAECTSTFAAILMVLLQRQQNPCNQSKKKKQLTVTFLLANQYPFCCSPISRSLHPSPDLLRCTRTYSVILCRTALIRVQDPSIPTT